MASASRELQLLGSRNPATLFFLTGFPFYSRFQNFFSYIYTREVTICYLIVYYLIFVHLLFNVWQKKSPLYYYNGVLYLLLFHQSESWPVGSSSQSCRHSEWQGSQTALRAFGGIRTLQRAQWKRSAPFSSIWGQPPASWPQHGKSSQRIVILV